MDLSGLIFVALAVAWAAYLIPKALRHHDDAAGGRSIDRNSSSMRVLAHREPVSARVARLVVNPARAATAAVVAKPAAAPLHPDDAVAPRRVGTTKATRRRRRVLSLILLALAATIAVCATGRLAWPYAAIPAGLLVAWLVACRLMVKKERSSVAPAPAEEPVETAASATAAPAPGGDQPAVRDPKLWDPVPTTLPTYVSKPPARRSVRTIDLDSTGVWTSGRTDADSALAREADAAERVRRHTSRKDTPGATSSAG